IRLLLLVEPVRIRPSGRDDSTPEPALSAPNTTMLATGSAAPVLPDRIPIMADATLARLTELIAGAERPEVRRAAVVVTAALKPAKDANLHKALVGALDADDAELRRVRGEALGELRVEPALARLVQIVERGGTEADAAVQALGHLGARGTKALGQVMAHAAPGLRRRIAAGLALAGTESAVLATAQTLVDVDPGVVEASARSLAAEVPSLSSAQKRALVEHLLEALKPPTRASRGRQPPEKEQFASARLSNVSEAAILRVLT